ncbi:GAF domain-containing protein [Mycolicibacterium parafortuitum]|uniref:GAF domain-containing protein n=1 Tax=Mycolicibacterium parafortuitum TaxID=39692 RepID=UPI0009F55CF7
MDVDLVAAAHHRLGQLLEEHLLATDVWEIHLGQERKLHRHPSPEIEPRSYLGAPEHDALCWSREQLSAARTSSDRYGCGVSPLAGFDDWLHSALADQADKAGQSVDAYVAQAVAARLMDDVTRRHGDTGDLLARLTGAGIAVPGYVDAPDPVVADPERLRALHATGLLDAPREVAYDRIADMAATALATPGAAVTLVDRDRQFFVAMHGAAGDSPEERQTPLDRSVCQYAVATGEPLVVTDARIDPVLKDNPAVTDGTVVAYLGIPLIDAGQHAIGTLCVWDTHPRDWTSGHVNTLRDLAQLASNRIFSA